MDEFGNLAFDVLQLAPEVVYDVVLPSSWQFVGVGVLGRRRGGLDEVSLVWEALGLVFGVIGRVLAGEGLVV